MRLVPLFMTLLKSVSMEKDVTACKYALGDSTLFVSNVCVMSLPSVEAGTEPETVGCYPLMRPAQPDLPAVRNIVAADGMRIPAGMLPEAASYAFIRLGMELYVLYGDAEIIVKGQVRVAFACDIPDGHPLSRLIEGSLYVVRPQLNASLRDHSVEASLMVRGKAGVACLLLRQDGAELLMALMQLQLTSGLVLHHDSGTIKINNNRKQKGGNAMPKVAFPQFTLPPQVKQAAATTTTKAQEEPLPAPPQKAAEKPAEKPAEKAPVKAEAPANDPVQQAEEPKAEHQPVPQALPDAAAFIESLKGTVTVATRDDAVTKLEQVQLIVAALRQLATWLNLAATAEKRFVQKGIAKSPLSEYSTPELLAELGRRAGK